MENKKTKLTISGSPKKSFKNFDTTKKQGKKTVIIDKKSLKPTVKNNFRSSSSNFKKDHHLKVILHKNFRHQLLAILKDVSLLNKEQQKKFQGDGDKEKKSKVSEKKRVVKLTVSRALSDEIETRERSLASVKRARQKELKNANKQEKEDNLKVIKKDINIPEVITVRELANRMAEQSSNVIKHLFEMGVTVTINQSLAADTAEYLVKEFGHNPIREQKAEEIIKKIKESRSENLKNRPPIITVGPR